VEVIGGRLVGCTDGPTVKVPPAALTLAPLLAFKTVG
jgi:hypothetical protein